MASAPRSAALSTKRGTLTGRISDDRRARSPAALYDPRARERCDPLARVADAPVDLVIVLTDARRGNAEATRRAVEARHHCVHGHLPHLVVRRLDDDAALLHVRVVEELADVVHRRRRHTRILEVRDGVGERPLRDEAAHDPSTSSRR